jgi:hypothetical protein
MIALFRQTFLSQQMHHFRTIIGCPEDVNLTFAEKAPSVNLTFAEKAPSWKS